MRWGFVYGFIPVPIIATDRLSPTVAACERGPLVFIRPQYLADHDVGLIRHELEHVRQYWTPVLIALLMTASLYALLDILNYPPEVAFWLLMVSALFHPVATKISPAYRFACEVMAYRVQARFYDDDRRPLFAQFIATRYGLGVSEQAALEALYAS